jgi:hypothetical protein
MVSGVQVELAKIRLLEQMLNAGPDVPKPKGRQVYGHKTGCEIEIHTAESWNRNKKYFMPNGARSCVKNFSKSVCS